MCIECQSYFVSRDLKWLHVSFSVLGEFLFSYLLSCLDTRRPSSMKIDEIYEMGLGWLS